MRVRLIAISTVVVYLVALGALLGAKLEQGENPPPFPNTYRGTVSVGDGATAPDGLEIFARVGKYDSHVPRPGFDERQVILVKGGEYERLVISPPDDTFIGKTITFFATWGFEEVQADETVVFQRVHLGTNVGLDNSLDLHFGRLPSNAPPGTPTPVPTITPTPRPTPVPPVPGDGAVPQLAQIVVISGAVAVVGGGAMLLMMRRREVF